MPVAFLRGWGSELRRRIDAESDGRWFRAASVLSLLLAAISLLLFYLGRARPESPVILLGFVLFTAGWLLGALALVVRAAGALYRIVSGRRRAAGPGEFTSAAEAPVRMVPPREWPTALWLGTAWALLVTLAREVVLPWAAPGFVETPLSALEAAGAAFVLGTCGGLLYWRLLGRWRRPAGGGRVSLQVRAGAISGALVFLPTAALPWPQVSPILGIPLTLGARVALAVTNGAVVGALLGAGARRRRSRNDAA